MTMHFYVEPACIGNITIGVGTDSRNNTECLAIAFNGSGEHLTLVEARQLRTELDSCIEAMETPL